MKKVYVLLVLAAALFSQTLSAQYCGGSGPGVCAPGGPYPQLGFYPPFDNFPCAVLGTAFSEKVDMQIPASTIFQGTTATINSIKIDSIENLPCGLCWRSSSANNTFNGNSTGCIQISGTTFDAPGQYKLRIRISVSATAFGFPVNLTNQDAEQYGIKYYVRVKPNAPATCPPVDTNAVSNLQSAPGTVSIPSISGNTSVCSGGSTTLTVSGNYDAYVWSNGNVGNTTTVNSGGVYTVTVYDNCASASASVNVTSVNATPTIVPGGPTTFCQGGSVILNAGPGFSSYNWSNGSTSQSITVTQSGTYTVTVTQGNCTGSDNETVTVSNNNLNPSITPGVVNICPGGTADLDAGAGYDTYSWSNAETTQTISVNSAGTFTVTVTQGSCSGTASATVNIGNFPVAVNITPAGPITACVGDVVILDAGSDFEFYSWSNGDDAQTTQPFTSGSYVVTIQDNGCVGRDTVVVTFNPLPEPEIQPSSTTICEGDAVSLTTSQAYDSYNWSNGSTTSSVIVSNAGTYFVTVSENGCSGSAINGATVVVNPKPTAGFTFTLNNTEYTYNASPDNALSYEWQSAVNQDTTSGQVIPFTFTVDTIAANCATQAGYWRVIVIASNGCRDTSNWVLVPVCVGTNDVVNEELSLTVHPSPAKNIIQLSYHIDKSTAVAVTLFDVNGRIVSTEETGVQTSSHHQHVIPVEKLTSGLYLVKISTNAGTAVTRFVKE